MLKATDDSLSDDYQTKGDMPRVPHLLRLASRRGPVPYTTVLVGLLVLLSPAQAIDSRLKIFTIETVRSNHRRSRVGGVILPTSASTVRDELHVDRLQSPVPL